MSILIITLFIILFSYLYLDGKLRNYLESSSEEDIGPYNNRFLTITHEISNFFKNRIWVSNMIFVSGMTLSISLFIVDIFKLLFKLLPEGILSAIGVIIFMLSIFLSASISGKTWLNMLYQWMKSKNKRIPLVIVEGLMCEFILVFPSLVFILFFWMVILIFLGKSPSPTNIRIICSVVPVFAVFWVYRFNDYEKSNDLQLNIRRIIMYCLVAVVSLKLNDPYTQLSAHVESPEYKLSNMFLNIDVVIFITLDRLGKTITELLREAKRKTESKIKTKTESELV